VPGWKLEKRERLLPSSGIEVLLALPLVSNLVTVSSELSGLTVQYNWGVGGQNFKEKFIFLTLLILISLDRFAILFAAQVTE